MSVQVFHGDSRDVLKTLADNSVDSCVCDPPYALVSIVKRFGGANAAPAKGNEAYARASAGFMGKTWDTGETAFAVEFWAEVFRVLKPGGHVIAASGTRTYHRLAVAIEDSGFEIRDMIQWLYGSGFPKSHDVSKGIDRKAGATRKVVGVKHRHGGGDADSGSMSGPLGTASALDLTEPATPEAAAWQGWGTALKPACEPWVLARKPLTGTVAANVLAHGTGALNIDGCRVVTDGPTARPPLSTEKHEGWQRPWNADPEARAGVEARREVAHDKRDNLGRFPANVIHDGSPEVVEAFPASDAGEVNPNLRRHAGGGLIYGEDGGGQPKVGHGDSGSAARFFYSAKADAVDRHGSRHPTVKPVDLMQYLCRLVTPPGGLVLDPFAGSGTTGIAAQREGFRAILIEREADYVADIHRRLKWEKGEGRLTSLERAKLHTPKAQAKANGLDTPLFGPKGDA